MNVNTELDRLFAQELRAIPKPAPLMCAYCGDSGDVHSIDGEWRGICTECDAFAALHPIDPVDADEAVHGVCAQGESDE